MDRTGGERGFCRVLDKPLVSSWGPHFGEERPLVGRFGSGTIFFSRCNLGCLFCQNWTISHQGEGTELSIDKLAGIMMELQDMGCHNINFVTPTHQMPMMLEALTAAKGEGLKLPIVYNCGGYESLQALEILDGIVDIYMPDLKYADTLLSLKYSGAEGYPEAAKTAIKEMHRQVGDLILDERGIAVRGLLVRHLVLPENMAGTDEVVRFLSQDISPDTYLNIMDQYHPCYRAKENPPLDRRITGSEYRTAITLAVKAGIKRLDGVTV
ncbi:MAG TPA: radical SAM protein [Thermodesulfovibrionales bacterium]|nr:radical SAM protein [Thermodesulfovibrionales bacterium]